MIKKIRGFFIDLNPVKFYKGSKSYAYSELKKKEFYKRLPRAYCRWIKSMFLWHFFNRVQ